LSPEEEMHTYFEQASEQAVTTRADLMKTRAFEVRYAHDRPLKYGLATTMAETWSASFIWEGRSHHTTARLLWLAGRMIDYYSKQVAPVDPASPEGRPRRLVSASRVRRCRLSPVCRGRLAVGHVVPPVSCWIGARHEM
jgi:hypothetical protein